MQPVSLLRPGNTTPEVVNLPVEAMQRDRRHSRTVADLNGTAGGRHQGGFLSSLRQQRDVGGGVDADAVDPIGQAA